MRRREIGVLLGSVVATSTAWPSVLGAQQKAMPVIGYLDTIARGPAAEPYVAAFHQD